MWFVLCEFFCFKQKTAYELRISDWSSDVCSSDLEMVTRWCKQHSRMPVIVKLTPNITNILGPARAAARGGADAVSLINTIQRSEERRLGRECVSTCKYRWSPNPTKNKT